VENKLKEFIVPTNSGASITGIFPIPVYKKNIGRKFTDAELKVISENITQSDMTCTLPLNKYILLVSLLIILLLIYMVLEHMNKRE
jgi:hypothetical protein